MSTVDREFGFIGRHIFHGIIEYHVVHHLFPYVYPCRPYLVPPQAWEPS